MKNMVLGAVAAVALACSSPVTGGTEGRLGIQVTSQALELTNESSGPIFHFVVDAETAARINWAPCNIPEKCLRIEAGETLALPLPGIVVHSPTATKVIVHWWHLVRDGRGWKADVVRSRIVEIPK